MRLKILICGVYAVFFGGCAGAHLSWNDIASGKLTEDYCTEKHKDKIEQEECKTEISAAKRAKSICEQEPYRKDYCYLMARYSWDDFVFIMDNTRNQKPTKNFADVYPVMCWDANGKVKNCEVSQLKPTNIK